MLEKISDIAGGEADASEVRAGKFELETDGGVSKWFALADLVEVGAFTPVAAGSTSAGVGTYVAQSGLFARIGRLFKFDLVLAWSAHTGTGDLTITGLPVTPAIETMLAISCDALTFSGQLVALIENGSSVIKLKSLATGANRAAIAMDSVATVLISGTLVLT